MAEENELEQRLDRIRHWAQSQSEMFRDGDVFVLRCDGDKVQVQETPASRLQSLHPRLHGRLSSLETQLETGCLLYVLALAFPAGVSFGLRQQWWDHWLDPRLTDELNAWWFFALLFAATVYFVSLVYERWRRSVYQRQRSELLEMIAAEGLERDTLVPLLEGDDDLSSVARQLKLDPGPFPTTPVSAAQRHDHPSEKP
jgi:hypothetical protein